MTELPDWLQECQDFCTYCLTHPTPRAKAADMWIEHAHDMLDKIRQLYAEIDRMKAEDDNRKWPE